jgi:hypothetical protein
MRSVCCQSCFCDEWSWLHVQFCINRVACRALVCASPPALKCVAASFKATSPERDRTANCSRAAAPHCASVECPAALFCISAQPKPSMFGWLFIAHLSLVINGELGQFALCHQHIMWLPCFCFPAVPHFNNRYLRVTCSTSRTSTATSTAPSTPKT